MAGAGITATFGTDANALVHALLIAKIAIKSACSRFRRTKKG